MSLTSVIRYARALDSTATDGSGKTGLAFGDVTAKYLIQGGTLTSLTTETITTLGTYQAPTDAAHIRIKELNSADPTKGIYEVHFHNTQVVSTGTNLWLFLSASGAAFQPLQLNLLDTVTLSAAGLANVQPAEPSAVPAFGTANVADILGWLLALARNKLTQTSTTQTLRNNSDNASIATSTDSDDGTTHTRGRWS